ncbi:MAG: ABC transporter substrate-binding protein [Proteobacteria bacterium]|nr:ABC transporter substrate-binding protein [Pseudomonadota bacterium]MBI3496967.1 ABC transporter substrate-binding protein [Pseudomonadota bacterium]
MRAIVSAPLVLAAVLTATTPGVSYAEMPKAVRVGIDVDAGTLDPRLARDTTAFRANDLIYDGLVQLSQDLKPVPDIAESWDNPAPTVWVFHLRKGVKFHDGAPLTAEDVVFTYRSIIDPKFNAPYRALVTPVASVDAIDASTVKFTLEVPYAPLLSYLDVGIVPKALVEGGRDIALKPIGTGPMKLAAWQRGASIKLEANADYWAGAPAAKTIELVVIGDNTARAQAFEAGDLDLIQSPLSPQDIKRLQADRRFVPTVQAGLGITYLNLNTADPILADPKMRRALAMLIDQKTIVGKIYEGVDQAATSILLPSSWAYSPEIKQPDFDPEGARALLASLGWKVSNGDGLLRKDGKPLKLTIATHSEDPNRVQAVEFMQAVMKQAGIQAEIQISDWPSFSTGYVQQGKHQVALLGWLNLVDPDRVSYGQLHTDGSLNWGKYANPALDALLDAGRQSLDLPGRQAAYRGAARVIADELPYYVLSYQGYQRFHNPKLGELQVNPRGYLRALVAPAK